MPDSFPSHILPEGKETAVTLTGPGNTPVPAVLTEPEISTNNAVVLCHGFLSDKQSRTNRRLTELLISEGIATLRFDWFGMGALHEYFAHMTLQRCFQQLDAIVSYLTDHGFTSLGLVGSSFGGFVTILSASRYPLLKAVGLKCPAVDFAECLQLELGHESMATWKNHNLIPNILQREEHIHLPYGFFEECRRYDGYEEASHITIPTRVVHGGKDDLIPSHQIDLFMKTLHGPKDLRILPEADHQFGRPEDFRIMTMLLAQWMIQHLTPSEGFSPNHESGTDPQTTKDSQ
ncbi:MAG: YqiA/YcfP family alpha/beta fold hydrolase [Nitrospirales bacterium]|nr:alpha/beta hydrolase [Nitrospirales bacterium]